jgi:hypothetical protein
MMPFLPLMNNLMNTRAKLPNWMDLCWWITYIYVCTCTTIQYHIHRRDGLASPFGSFPRSYCPCPLLLVTCLAGFGMCLRQSHKRRNASTFNNLFFQFPLTGNFQHLGNGSVSRLSRTVSCSTICCFPRALRTNWLPPRHSFGIAVPLKKYFKIRETCL